MIDCLCTDTSLYPGKEVLCPAPRNAARMDVENVICKWMLRSKRRYLCLTFWGSKRVWEATSLYLYKGISKTELDRHVKVKEEGPVGEKLGTA